MLVFQFSPSIGRRLWKGQLLWCEKENKRRRRRRRRDALQPRTVRRAPAWGSQSAELVCSSCFGDLLIVDRTSLWIYKSFFNRFFKLKAKLTKRAPNCPALWKRAHAGDAGVKRCTCGQRERSAVVWRSAAHLCPWRRSDVLSRTWSCERAEPARRARSRRVQKRTFCEPDYDETASL